MSQFCGSFCALSSRSLLTVSLYSAAGADATSAATDRLANAMQLSAAQLSPNRLLIPWGTTRPPLLGRLFLRPDHSMTRGAAIPATCVQETRGRRSAVSRAIVDPM